MAETDQPKCERSHQEALSQRCDTKAWELEGMWVCGCVRGVRGRCDGWKGME